MSGDTFKEKIVWITGASSGIGEALAYAFSAEGAHVIISARRVDRLEQVKSRCADPSKVTIVPLDLERYREIGATVKPVIEKVGHIDLLVNNAGISLNAPAIETELSMTEKVFATNFFGQIEMTRAVLPGMLQRNAGQICVISSLSGKAGFPGFSTYCASKFALHGYFDGLRAEVAKNNIGVTMICPGFVKTEIALHGHAGDGSPRVGTPRGMPAEKAAAKTLKAIRRRRSEVYIGSWEMIAVYLMRWSPSLAFYLARTLVPRMKT